MSDRIMQLNKQVIKTELKDLVKQRVEDTLNSILDKKMQCLLEHLGINAQNITLSIICVT